MGVGLPRRFASWIAVRSNQSSSWSSRYRMAFGKSLGRAVLREGRPGRASGGLLDGESNLPVENRSGVWFLMGSRPMPRILPPSESEGNRESGLEPSDVYIICINASGNLMPIRRSIPQNTILISRHASPSSNRISRSRHGFVGSSAARRLQGLFYSPVRHFLLFLPTNYGYKVSCFHSEIIGCLETQSAGRGHHQTSAH
jgi:hypothetical protein